MTTTMPSKNVCNRGDVVLVLFPHSDLKTAKTRPAVVVQADTVESGMPQVIVAMISGRMFRAGHPSRVLIEKASMQWRRSGLLGDSVVMADNLATVALTAIDRVIGSVGMPEIDGALRHTLGL
ncbi:MAG: type II toxin-antitoxin system PemK/MazF family toxin [Pirellulales bacterium]